MSHYNSWVTLVVVVCPWLLILYMCWDFLLDEEGVSESSSDDCELEGVGLLLLLVLCVVPVKLMVKVG